MTFTEEQKKEFDGKWCNVWILHGRYEDSTVCFLCGKIKFLGDMIQILSGEGLSSLLSYRPICGMAIIDQEGSSELDSELFESLFGEKVGKDSS